MRPNQQVTTLRKGGKLIDALNYGVAALQNNPNDTYLKGALAWVYYELIRNDCQKLKSLMEKNPSHSAKAALSQQIHANSQHYYRLHLPLPEMAASNIMRVMADAGRYLPFFAGWCAWFGVAGFSQEDFAYFAAPKGNFPSLFTRVARELAAWRTQPENTTNEADGTILQFLQTAIQNNQEDEANKVWLYKDLSKFYLQQNDFQNAKESLRPVLKAKSREFWIWGDLAKIEEHTSDEMAISCLCQALLCKAPVNFTGPIRLHLARLLIDKGQIATAVTECLTVAEAYQKEEWKFSEQLEAMMQSDWFNPELKQSQEQQIRFYRQHAQQAQLLIYENLRQQEASYLESFTLGQNNQLKALFAVQQNGRAIQLLADAPWSESSQPVAGTGYTLTLGDDSRGTRVLRIKVREASTEWDCLDWFPAVIEHLNENKKVGSLFRGRNNNIVIRDSVFADAQMLGIGAFVRVRVAYNAVREREEAYGLVPAAEPISLSDVQTKQDVLRVHEKGFAFVDDVFVPPPLVEAELDDMTVEVLCVYKKKRNENSYGWAALKVTPVSG